MTAGPSCTAWTRSTPRPGPTADCPLRTARRHGAYESWVLSDVVASIHGDCGGPLEIATLGCSPGALPATQHLAHLLRDKGLRCELDVWGHDVPRDWPSWRAQRGHHLPRFC